MESLLDKLVRHALNTMPTKDTSGTPLFEQKHKSLYGKILQSVLEFMITNHSDLEKGGADLEKFYNTNKDMLTSATMATMYLMLELVSIGKDPAKFKRKIENILKSKVLRDQN